MEDSCEKILKEQAEQLENMKLETQNLFEKLQIDKESFINSLNDKDQYSPEEWAKLQRNRALLSQEIDKRIAKAMGEGKKNSQTSSIQPHWIFVR